MSRRTRVVRREEPEVDGEEQRRVELRLAGDLGERADLVVPAARLEQLARPRLDRARVRRELGRLERLRDLDRAPRARPVHEHREAVQPRLPAELPETGVGLLEPRVHLVDEPLDHLDRRVSRHLADEARVEEEPADAEHHLAVDVVLDVLERLVADPHRPVAVEAGEVRELALGRLRVAVDPVRGLEHAVALLARGCAGTRGSAPSPRSARAARARSA